MRNSARLLCRLLRAARNRDGATAMEFAFIAPAAVLLTMGTVETSLVMYAQNVLETATFNASRLGKTGFVSGGSQGQGITAMIAARAGGLLNPSQVTVTSGSYADYSQVGLPEPFVDTNGNDTWNSGESFTDMNGNGVWDADRAVAGYGGSGQVVVYTVSYPWQIFTPILGYMFPNNGSITLSARAVVKNEPF